MRWRFDFRWAAHRRWFHSLLFGESRCVFGLGPYILLGSVTNSATRGNVNRMGRLTVEKRTYGKCYIEMAELWYLFRFMSMVLHQSLPCEYEGLLTGEDVPIKVFASAERAAAISTKHHCCHVYMEDKLPKTRINRNSICRE